MFIESPFKMKTITREKVLEYQGKNTKRICFSTTHNNALKRQSALMRAMPFSERSECVGWFNIPFYETMEFLFPFRLFKNKHDRYYRRIDSEEEFEEIRAWKEAQNGKVFLRDCLSASFALSTNFTDEEKRKYTPIGELEHNAKEHQDKSAIRQLAHKCVEAINSFPLYYLEADFIAAVPPSLDKDSGNDLPSQIVDLVSKHLGKPDITCNFKADKPKRPVKTLGLEDRWAEWENTGLEYDGDLTGKSVILIDDKYQSGSSIQYVAMKLQESGVSQVFGLCLIKTMRDSDNQ